MTTDDRRTIRQYAPGDRVKVRSPHGSAYDGATGAVRAVLTATDGHCTITVALDGFEPLALPFAASELDLREQGDRMLDDLGGHWRLPHA